MSFSLENYLAEKTKNVPWKSAQAVITLAGEGGTVPFIARYRKEKTGNLDEVQIRAVLDARDNYDEVVKRKNFILEEIEKQGELTESLKKQLSQSMDLVELDEIYRPFKKKKKTKATLAKEAGLEPLAQWIWALGRATSDSNSSSGVNLEVKAKEFLNSEKAIVTYDLALKGAQDILVERIYNDPELRQFVRDDYFKNGKILSKKGKKFKEKSKYEVYADFEDTVVNLLKAKASYRYLAMRRGWQESELTVLVKGREEEIHNKFEKFVLEVANTPAAEFLKKCAQVAFTNHVYPSISNEVHRILKETADDHAIGVFTENVRKLLLASPFGAKCILGVDPGLRTGCKVALVNKGGEFISHTVLHIQGKDAEESVKKLLKNLSQQIALDAIAVGNGTAGRETEAFLRKVVKELEVNVPIVLVNESGASVYSASDVAREEFPDLDLTVRGAISIARRLQDPLAELVKIEPKSIGVGQYQHDVNQSHLKKGLQAEVESCVNVVGVDVNTASASLLSYVSGIGPVLAKNIVDHRVKNGLFKEREGLKSVDRLSDKVFEQSAGFLRVTESENVLDRTGIHPERYAAVREMAKNTGIPVTGLMGDGAKKLLDERTKWVELIGEYTFVDIMEELEKPGRDPRDPFKIFQFREDIYGVKDLKQDMICPGIVTNVTNFGAFVDIGVHQDGLVHLSEMANTYVTDTRKIVNPGDQVKVKVLKIDQDKKQISLSMKIGGDKTLNRDTAPSKKRPPRKTVAKKSANERTSANARPNAKRPNEKRQQRPHKKTSSSPPRKKQGFNNPFAAALGDLNIKK